MLCNSLPLYSTNRIMRNFKFISNFSFIISRKRKSNFVSRWKKKKRKRRRDGNSSSCRNSEELRNGRGEKNNTYRLFAGAFCSISAFIFWYSPSKAKIIRVPLNYGSWGERQANCWKLYSIRLFTVPLVRSGARPQDSPLELSVTIA